MFFEQHALEPNIGAAYFWLSLVKGGRDLQTHALEDWMERGYAALQVMENHLKTRAYFAADQLTVADIALYGYTHVADRCDYDLATFPPSAPGCGGSNRSRVSSTMDWQPETEVDDPARIAAGALSRSTFARGPAQTLTTAGITLTFAVISPFSVAIAAMLPRR